MGGMKEYAQEIEDRGWDAPDKSVCFQCMEEEFLSGFIKNHADSSSCSYCDKQVKSLSLEKILPIIFDSLSHYYIRYDLAFIPREIEDVNSFSTSDVLEVLGLQCEGDVFADIEGSFFKDEYWVPAVNGDWLGISFSDKIFDKWKYFKTHIIEESRFFFTMDHINKLDKEYPSIEGSISSIDFFNVVGGFAFNLGLVKLLEKETCYFRARKGINHLDFKSIGPPENKHATAGRMNPVGISYFYLSSDEKTALCEIKAQDGDRCSLAQFELKDDIFVIDFSQKQNPISMFDVENKTKLEMISFWNSFSNEIRKPVVDASDINYLPTQVLSEYFSKVFRLSNGHKVSGFIYPSAYPNVGKNLVIFPEKLFGINWEDRMKLINVDNVEVGRPIQRVDKIAPWSL